MSRASVVRAANSPDPETIWAALAPALAAKGRMRVSRDGGRNYRRLDERNVTDRLPNQPAAVHTYDASGCAPVICLDLDASKGGPEAVTRDHAAITRLLDKVGARWFSDHSPNRGRHIYVPLAEPAPFGDATAFVRALAARTPTLDPQPMLNLTDGCLRPPGARHRSGGHQMLDGSLSGAVDALHARTSPDAWRRLLEETATPIERPSLVPVTPVAATSVTGAPVDFGSEPRLEALHGYTAPDGVYAHIARTGEWSSEQHPSASHARQAVVWAAVASGWSLVDVARRLSDGTWAGLASMYAKYPTKHRHTALVRDWRKAVAFEAARRSRSNNNAGTQSVRVRTTSPHQTQPGARGAAGSNTNQQVRVWLTAVDLLTRRADPAVRAVLYALGEAAALTGSLLVEHGNRSLAIATGLDQSTVGRALKAVREAPRDRLLIDLVKEAEQTRAHLYALVIPDLIRPACEKKAWRRGKIHAIRPAFRELGLVPAFVYAALEQRDDPIGGRDLAADAGFGHSATYDALAVLASWGLAEKVKGGWVRGKASLIRLAEYFGIDVQVAAQVKKYREERLAWWRYLGIVEPLPPEVLDDQGFDGPPGDQEVAREPFPYSPALDWTPAQPPRDTVVALADWRRANDAERAGPDAAAAARALALLEDVLGAREIRDGSG